MSSEIQNFTPTEMRAENWELKNHIAPLLTGPAEQQSPLQISGETLVEGPFSWDYSHFCAGYAREEPMNSENLNFTPTEMRAENG